jgi:hypothetical protein
MKERAPKKISGRIFMVRLLGDDASNAGCLIHSRTIRRLDSARQTVALTRVPAGYELPPFASNT